MQCINKLYLSNIETWSRLPGGHLTEFDFMPYDCRSVAVTFVNVLVVVYATARKTVRLVHVVKIESTTREPQNQMAITGPLWEVFTGDQPPPHPHTPPGHRHPKG